LVLLYRPYASSFSTQQRVLSGIKEALNRSKREDGNTATRGRKPIKLIIIVLIFIITRIFYSFIGLSLDLTCKIAEDAYNFTWCYVYPDDVLTAKDPMNPTRVERLIDARGAMVMTRSSYELSDFRCGMRRGEKGELIFNYKKPFNER
jgi:hypothetical protein